MIVDSEKHLSVKSKTSLLDVYSNRNAYQNYSSLLKELQETISDNEFHDLDYYDGRLKVNYENVLSNLTSIIYTEDTSHLQSLDADANLLFISYKLKAFILMFRHIEEIDSDINYNMHFLEEILNYIRKNKPLIYNENPIIYCDYLILMTFLEPDKSKWYPELKRYITAVRNKLTPEQLRQVYIEMKNYCDDRIIQERKKYSTEIFLIYKKMDAEGLLSFKKYIHQFDFMNAVIAGLEMKQFKWVDRFFNKYKTHLDKNSADDTLYLMQAHISFYKKDYDKSLIYLNKVNSKFFFYFLRVKVLTIKIFYELRQFDSLYYLIDSVRHYIKRKKSMIGVNYYIITGFLNYIKRIIKLHNSFDKAELELLHKQIMSDNKTGSKLWLLSIINNFTLSQT